MRLRAAMKDNCTLRYCPLCWKEDERRYGVRYWHRQHHIKILPYCPKHHVKLWTVDKASYEMLAAQTVCPNENTEPIETPFVCEKPIMAFLGDPEMEVPTRDEFLYAFAKRGLITKYTCHLNRSQLISLLESLYTPDLVHSCLLSNNGRYRIEQRPSTVLLTYLIWGAVWDELNECRGKTNFEEGFRRYLEDAAFRELENGVPMGIICKRYNMPKQSLVRAASERGVQYVNGKLEWPEKLTPDGLAAKRARWHELCKSAATVEQLYRNSDEAAGLSEWLQKYDGEWYQLNRLPTQKEQRERKLALLTEEMSPAEAQAVIGCSLDWYYRARKKKGYMPYNAMKKEMETSEDGHSRESLSRKRERWIEMCKNVETIGQLKKTNTSAYRLGRWLSENDGEWFEQHRLPTRRELSQRRMELLTEDMSPSEACRKLGCTVAWYYWARKQKGYACIRSIRKDQSIP